MNARSVLFAGCLALVLAASTLAQDRPASTTAIIVRHAEKDTAKTDPALTAKGMARARELERIVGTATLDAVIASDRRRTLETAAPAARAHGVRIDTLAREGAIDEYAERIARRLAALGGGKTALVVSHSDVIPALLKDLGVTDSISIPDEVYDDLFIVTIRSDGGPTFLHLKYGAPPH